VPEIPVYDYRTVLAAISAADAVERVRDGFVRFAAGEWEMPPKVYVDAPPRGDFRAMPARGGGLAILKWATSFTGNPPHGLPVVQGAILVSSAETGAPLALMSVEAVTSLRTGAVAAVAAQELAREDARTAGIVGCGVNGSWAARCMAAAEYGPGVCYDPDPDRAGALAGELGWEVGSREEAMACDVVTCITPGNEPVVLASDLRPGMHLSLLGADAAGTAEAEVAAVTRCVLFCDEWHQASHGGELTQAVEAGLVTHEDVTDLGAVMTGEAPGRPDDDAITMFDSTGLAIQDLALCLALVESPPPGLPTVSL
jgi:alanine dehydrogenase